MVQSNRRHTHIARGRPPALSGMEERVLVFLYRNGGFARRVCYVYMLIYTLICSNKISKGGRAYKYSPRPKTALVLLLTLSSPTTHKNTKDKNNATPLR